MREKSKWRFQYKSLKVQEALQEFEGWTDKEFVKHILELRKEIIELEAEKEAALIKPTPGAEEEKPEGLSEKNFNLQWSYPTKVAFLLTITNKPLMSEEIHKMLVKMDRHYSAYGDPKGTLSVYLTMAVKRGRIKKIKLPGIKTLYFALPEWIDEIGGLNSEYRYHTNYFKSH
jgi:hypothetical protein